MKLNDILYEKGDGIAIATFNRPRRLNAFRQSTLLDLINILEDLQSDDSLRVLIMTGTGRAFCAGEDLKELEINLDTPQSLRQLRDYVELLQDITRRMVNHPKVIIAAINGIAVGGGAEFAVACDIRIASETATLAFVEAKRALFPTNGVLYLLPRLIGQGRAMDMLLTGNVVTASEMLEIGLVSQVTAEDKLIEKTTEMARAIRDNAPVTLRLIKQALRQSYEVGLEAVMQLEIDGCMQCLASEDQREGLRSFLEKRPAVYTGK